MNKFGIVALLLLSSSIMAQSHLIDASMRDLNYLRPDGNHGRAGNISFTRLELKRPSMNMTIDNGSRVFDSNIDLSGRTVNLRGNNHRLRFSFNDQETVNLLDEASVSNITFRLTDDLLTQSADRIFLRKNQDEIELGNYQVECKQHPDYNMRDTQTLMYGCMNEATLTPKTGSSLSLVGKYNHEKLGAIDLDSRIKSVKVRDTYTELKLGTTQFNIADSLDVNVERSLTFTCQKSSDVTVMNKDRLIEDCSNDFRANMSRVVINGGLELGERNEFTSMGLTIDGGFIGNGRSSIMVQAQNIIGGVGSKAIEASKISLRCNKTAGFDSITAENLQHACTSNMELRTMDSSRYSLFKMTDTNDQGQVEVKALLNSMSINNSKAEIVSARTIINHPKMEIRMTGVSGHAAKYSGALDLKDFDRVAKKALTNFKLERNDVVIKNKEERNSWIFMVLDKIEGKNSRLKINLPAIQTVNGDDIKSYYWLNVDCSRRESDDLSLFGVARGCARNGTISMTHLIKTKGIKARAVRTWYPTLLTFGENSGTIPSNLTLDDSQQVRNIEVSINANNIFLSLEAKIAGIWKSIQVGGRLTVNEARKRLEIRRTSGNIPTGLLNFGIDQALGEDIITTDGDMWYIKFGN